MDKDIITFVEEKEARDFYLLALSLGIWANWKGAGVAGGNMYWTVHIDKKKTFEREV